MNFSPGALLTNNRTRILDVFEKWLNELDTIQHVDFQRATVCLHHIARLLEDAVLVPMNSSSLMNDDGDDERFEVLLSRVLLEDYSEVIYNAFRSMVTTADTNYQNACLRVVVILKLTSREIGDLFAEVLPMTELEDFVKEQINHPNELLRARVGFLLGEMLLEEKNLPDIPIETILQPRIPRIKELRLLLEEKSDELIEAMAHVHEIAKYTSNASIPIPEPDSPTPDASIWGVDECGTEGTALHYLTILNGLLHLTAALIEFSEALAIAVSESLLKECIEILKLPAVPVQTFCMILIGNALIHRKLAMDFIELDGPSEVYRLIDTYRHGPTKGDFETFSSHATFIISSIFKHSSAVDLYVKPTNAHQIVGFMFSLFNNWDSLGTNLNILEWCAEAIHHPLLLRVIHAANFWKKVKSICDSLIRMKTNPDRKADSMFFLEHFRSVTVLALKYIVAHMFWGYQYSKSLFSDMDDLKPLSKSFGTLIRKNYVGQAGTVDIVQALSSSPAVIKIDEAEMYALEAYVFKSLIRTGHLPKGNANTTSYDPLAAFNFQVEPIGYYSSSPSAAATTAAAAATSSADVDYDAQSVVSMVTKVLPEWTIVDAAIREGIVPALFHILMLENKDSTTVCMALLCLQLLCVDAAAIVEVMQYDLAKHFDAATIQNTSELAAFQYKKGLEVLLYSVTSQERRDPSVMVSVLRLLAAMSAAPYFRYNGHDSSVAHSFFEDYLKSPYFAATQLPPHHQQHPLAEKKKPLFDTAKKQISSKLAYNALENVQRSVRKAIRAHAGISILTQMLYYKKNVTFSIPIRLETLKILLGLQQDDDIRQILVKLRLPTVLENQIQAEKSQSNMYDMNTIPQKLHDRALLQFYTDNLVNLLRGVAIGGIGGVGSGVGGGVGGGGIDTTGLSLLDDAQEHLLRKTVVDHSNIEFSQFELLYLIRDHLAAMGLTKSATTLEAELIEREQQANQRQKMYGSSSSSGTKPAASTTTDSHHKAGSHSSGSRLAALTRQASIERRLSGIHLPEGPSAAVVDDAAVAEAEGETAPGSKKRLRDVIETPAAAVDVTEDSATTAHASSSSVSSAKRLSVAFAAVATNAGPDGDGDDDPTSSPPPLKYSSSARKAATAAVAPLAGSALKRLPSSGTTATAAAAAAAAVQATPTAVAASSKLSAIMRRYLRLQHCQCKHPVSTLPVMSLLKPHVCPKPPPIQFYNINRIVHRYQPICGNAQWMRHYRHDVQAGQLHHLYASYRTVMTEEEDGYMVTACAFGQQPHRLWLGWYNYDNGAEVTMVDTSQQDTLGEAYDLDLPGMIDSFVFPDMHYSASAAFAQPQQPILATMIQSHMITQGQTAGKEVYLYRDRDSAEVFQSPALHKLSITAEDIRQVMAASQPGYTVPASTLVDDDLRCFESIAFSRETGRYLAASMVNDVLPMGAAFVFDVESGVVVHRLLNEASGGSGGGPMYAYPQVHYVPEEDQVLWFDGKLFDLRTNATLHRFDKLSQYGNAAFHPNGYDVIIDSAIWDLRMFGLRQTVPLLENCRVQFDRFGGGLIAAMSMKDDDRPFASIREEYLGFHVLHPGDYSHIHTQNVVKAGQVSGYGLAEVQVDRHGGGLVAGILLAGAQEATMSQCKVPSRQTPTGGRGGAAFPRRAGGGGGGGGYSRR
eukprot:gene4332-3095_t